MNQLQRVSITKLTVGCYVERVSKQLGDVRVVQTGWVRNQKSIDDLKKKGVIEVIIDQSKEMQSNKVAAAPAKIEQPPIKTKQLSFANEFDQALQTYNQLEKAMQDIEQRVISFQPINIWQLELLIHAILESTKRNPSCLLCITKIKTIPDSIIGHSMRVAILLAATHHLVTKKQENIISLILCALLHDLGKYKLAGQLQKQDHLLNSYLKIQRHKYCQSTLQILSNSGGAPEDTILLCQYQLVNLQNEQKSAIELAQHLHPMLELFMICDTFDSLSSGFEGEKSISSKACYQYLIKKSPLQFNNTLIKRVIKQLGMYPAGFLVQLESGKLGYIKGFKDNNTSTPLIHCFYNVKSKLYINIHEVILSAEFSDDKIDANVLASQFGLDLTSHLSSL